MDTKKKRFYVPQVTKFLAPIDYNSLFHAETSSYRQLAGSVQGPLLVIRTSVKSSSNPKKKKKIHSERNTVSEHGDDEDQASTSMVGKQASPREIMDVTVCLYAFV